MVRVQVLMQAVESVSLIVVILAFQDTKFVFFG